MRIHEALSQALKQHGLSAHSIATAAGLADSQVSFFLSGQRGMSYEKMNAFLEALPPSVYQEVCRLMAGSPEVVCVENAIAVLASAPLTDDQLASLLTIASQRLRQPSQTVQRTEQFPVAV
jgi:transcriptional regulator with XRE-family HTH domain